MFRRGCYVLIGLDLLLGIAHLLWPEYRWGQGRGSYFNLSNQLSLGSWVASMQLVLIALLGLVGFHRMRSRSLPASIGWAVIAVAGLFLSLVEIMRLPRRLGWFGYPSPATYEQLVVSTLGICLLGLAGWFVLSQMRGHRSAKLAATGWLAAWTVALVSSHVASLSAESVEPFTDFVTGAGFLVGCTLLLFSAGEGLLRSNAELDAVEPMPADPYPEGRGRIWILAAVGATTFTLIVLQITLFQLLTIFGDYITANTIISVALLGISVGGLIGFFAAGQAPMRTMVGASLLLPFTIFSSLGVAASQLDSPLFASLLLTLPFVCCSVIITVALARSQSHVVYCVDLIGAALGAFLVSATLSTFREESGLILLGAFGFLITAAFLLAHPSVRFRKRLAGPTLTGFVLFLALGALNMQFDWFNVVRTKTRERFPRAEVLYSESSLVGRFDVVRRGPESTVLKALENGRTIDTIRDWPNDHYQIDPRVPHTLMEKPSILILGLSGDAIAKTATFIGGRVVGLEINPIVARMHANELRELNGASYDGIEVVVMDGRSYVERSDEQFDMITLMNAHFAKGHVRGRSASAEYLQTLEAMAVYLERLTDRGVLNVEEPLARPVRAPQIWKLLLTMRQALLDAGAEAPERHFFVFQWKTQFNNYVQILMKKTPFTDTDLANLRRWLDEADRVREIEDEVGYRLGPINSRSTLLFSPDESRANNFEKIIRGTADPGLLAAYNLQVVTDNVPFPFDLNPARPEIKQAYQRTLVMMLLLLPFFAYFVVRQRSDLGRAVPFVSVVGLTGMGYLLLEIVLIQRYTIFLGSPVVTLSTVLGSLLIFSGLGSLWSGRATPRTLVVTMGSLLLVLLAHLAWMPAAFRLAAGLPLGLRIGLAVLSMAPLAFLMGVPFPFILRVGKQHFSESSAAMLFSINAATSALAVPLALNISTARGMNQVFVVSVIIYAAVGFSLLGAYKPRLQLPANLSASILLIALLSSPWMLSRPAVADSSAGDRYEVYALSYGASRFREDRIFQGGAKEVLVPFEWMFWLIRGQGKTILVDTGFDDPERAQKWRIRDSSHPTERLAQLGIAPADVTDVILTHAHWDHMGLISAYTNARIWIQEAEYQHASALLRPTRPLAGGMRWRDFSALLEAEEAGRVERIDGEAELAPGITMTLGGSHTPGAQYVTVETSDGPVVLASDNSYLYANSMRHAAIGTLVDVDANLAAFDEMQRKVASPWLLIPGHDPTVMRYFPEVSEEVVQITVAEE